jgi:RHH-type transcriptional regulator, rel operon repressor / antitoxin RelB
MTSVRLPANIENRLSDLCQLTKRSKSFYIKEAIEQYLEDMEDTYIALERISNPGRTFLSTEGVIEELKK